MNYIREFLYRPKRSDRSLIARFYFADLNLSAITAELDSFDGKRDPERCSKLISKLKSCQDKLLHICHKMHEEIEPGRCALSREFRVKFPDDVLTDYLPGQLWFGAECLASGSSILHKECESEAMRPLARAVTKSLENVRVLLREQCLSQNAQNKKSFYSERICENLKIFDSLFAQFEYCYVQCMVHVKTTEEYELNQDLIVLFSEALQRAIHEQLISQDMVDSYEPSLMFAVPRISIVYGLINSPSGPLNVDKRSAEFPKLFLPFKNLLRKIRRLLLALDPHEVYVLEMLLCQPDEPVNIESKLIEIKQIMIEREIQKEVAGAENLVLVLATHSAESREEEDKILMAHVQQEANKLQAKLSNELHPESVQCSETDTKRVKKRKRRDKRHKVYVADEILDDVINEVISVTCIDAINEYQCISTAAPFLNSSGQTTTACIISVDEQSEISTSPQLLYDSSRQTLAKDSIIRASSSVETPKTRSHHTSNHQNRSKDVVAEKGVNIYFDNEGGELVIEEPVAPPRRHHKKRSSSFEKRQRRRAKFKSTEDLLHRLYVCISGAADQLQSNYASDFRTILRTVFTINMAANDENDGTNTKKDQASSSAVESGESQVNSDESPTADNRDFDTRGQQHYQRPSSQQSYTMDNNMEDEIDPRHLMVDGNQGLSRRFSSSIDDNLMTIDCINDSAVDVVPAVVNGESSQMLQVDSSEMVMSTSAESCLSQRSDMVHRRRQQQQRSSRDHDIQVQHPPFPKSSGIGRNVTVDVASSSSAAVVGQQQQQHFLPNNRAVYERNLESSVTADVTDDERAINSIHSVQSQIYSPHFMTVPPPNVVSSEESRSVPSVVSISCGVGNDQHPSGPSSEVVDSSTDEMITVTANDNMTFYQSEPTLINIIEQDSSLIDDEDVEEEEEEGGDSGTRLDVGSAEDAVSTATSLSGSIDSEEGGQEGDEEGRQRDDGGGDMSPKWIPDSDAPSCMGCQDPFTLFRRRHHCRNCGQVYCSRCCSHFMPIPQLNQLRNVRVCNKCFVIFSYQRQWESVERVGGGSATSPSENADSPQSLLNPRRNHSECGQTSTSPATSSNNVGRRTQSPPRRSPAGLVIASAARSIAKLVT